MKKVSAYFESQVDFAARQRYLLAEETPKLEDWIGGCVVKGTPRDELKEYQVMGQFIGEKMIFFMTMHFDDLTHF